MATTDHLTLTFAALAHPARRGMLARLAVGDASVTELAEPYEMSLAAVSKHLKVLEGAGLVSRGKDAQWRPCHLEAKPLAQAQSWLEEYRRFWERNLDSLGAYLKTMRPERDRNAVKEIPRSPNGATWGKRSGGRAARRKRQ